MNRTWLLIVASCASPPQAHPPPSIDVKPAAPPSAAENQRAAERKTKADDAVGLLAVKLNVVERTCREKWMDPTAACGDPDFATIASDYQAVYAEQDDPRAREGREDALPRLGGRDVPVKDVEWRIQHACTTRCDRARRLAVAQEKEEAVEKCTTAPKKQAECKGLAAHVAPDAPDAIKNIVADCEASCDSRRRDLAAALAREANRPRTPAQSHACFRECMKSCTGGRIVPDADGHYTKDPDDFCGTCDVSCESSCAVRP